MIHWIKSNFLIMTLISPFCFGSPVERHCTEEGLSIMDGSYILSNGVNVNSVVMYSCHEGFYPYPTLIRRCLKSGRWHPAPKKSDPAMCKMITCPDPTVFEHGTVSPNQIRYYFNNETTYECFDGYTSYGSEKRVCQANGKWSGSTPTCDRGSGFCRDPGVPPGARRTGRHFDIDDKVSYRCDQDLILIGSQERVCQGSTEWSGIEPACYYKHTYDTPEEVKAAFAVSLGGGLEQAASDETNKTQHEKKIRLDQGGNLHIYIAIDASDSVLKDNFELSKSSVIKLIEKISYYEITPKYEILAFATEVDEIVDITNPDNAKVDVIAELQEFKYEDKGDKSGTNIALAFHKILEKMSFIKEQTKDTFKDIRHVIIIFTDGMANMGGSAQENADKIKNLVHSIKGDNRQEYLDIYAFAVGPEIDETELDLLVSKKPPETHFYKLKDDKTLEQTFDEMIDESDSVGLCGLYRDYASMHQTQQRQRYPWLAKISVTRPGNSSTCVGALVTQRFVLTAAHCFRFGDRSESISVEIGSSPSQVMKVKHFYIHTNFNILAKKDIGIPEFYDYDVALLELAKDVAMTVYTRPICIPCTKETSRALGFSDLAKCKDQENELLKSHFEEASFMSVRLERKDVRIKLGPRRDNCIEDAKKAKGIDNKVEAKEIVTDNFLCTGGIEPQTDMVACKGDSGGALYVERKRRLIQVGVVSWGVMDLCAQKNKIRSEESSRDFHINLFKVQPFLKQHLGRTDQSYAPLTFID